MKKGTTDKYDPKGMSLLGAVAFLLVGMIFITLLVTTSWGRKISLKKNDKARNEKEANDGSLLSLITSQQEQPTGTVSVDNLHGEGLQSIEISFANTEDGNGAVILEKLLKIKPQAALKEKRVMELTEQLAKKKEFSLYPEVAVYPKDFYALWKRPYPFSAKEYDNLRALLQGTVVSIQDRDDIPKEKAFQSIMVTGVKLAAEQDYNTVSDSLVGIGIAQTACKALIDHYADGSDQEKAERYLKYKQALDSLEKKIRESGIKWTPLLEQTFDQEFVREVIQQSGAVQQPLIQIENLTPLAYMYYMLEDQRKELSGNALGKYRDSSQSQFVREFSGRVLEGEFEWQIKARGKQLKEELRTKEQTQ